MNPVMQTKFGTEGNCLMASFASIAEVPLESLPDLDTDDDGGWWQIFQRTAVEHGFVKPKWATKATTGPPSGYSIAVGPAARGYLHCCVALDGEVVHDPHPDNTGLTSIDYWIVLMREENPE